jgi:hypothetical protein
MHPLHQSYVAVEVKCGTECFVPRYETFPGVPEFCDVECLVEPNGELLNVHAGAAGAQALIHHTLLEGGGNGEGIIANLCHWAGRLIVGAIEAVQALAEHQAGEPRSDHGCLGAHGYFRVATITGKYSAMSNGPK